METTFSVIIPSYNGKIHLRRALAALKKSSIQPRCMIIVDDCSSDGTVEMLEAEFPDVVCLRNEKNSGPSASRNRGVQHTEGTYLVFLDNDVLVHRCALERLLHFLAAHPEAGMVGGKLITEAGTPMWWNMGYTPNNFREGLGYLLGAVIRKWFPRSRLLKDFSMQFSLNYWDYDRSLEVGWVCEALCALPRELFQQVGGFDEGFFMFFEGPDLSERLRSLGYKTYFCHEAEAMILAGHTHPEPRRRALWLAGKRRYYQKHLYPFRSNAVFFWLTYVIRRVFYREPR